MAKIQEYHVVSADWKEPEEIANSFMSTINHFGLSCIPHPGYEGSDTYGFIVSRTPLTPDELRAFDDSPDPEETMTEEEANASLEEYRKEMAKFYFKTWKEGYK